MTDPKTFRLVVVGLILLAAGVVAGGIALAWVDKGLPGELIAIGSAAAGALAGIMSKGPSGEPQQVRVVNPPGDPANVEDVGNDGGATDTRTIAVAAIIVGLIVVALLIL